jgi:T5SS/PEP-CTERM-associated repeat protein
MTHLVSFFGLVRARRLARPAFGAQRLLVATVALGALAFAGARARADVAAEGDVVPAVAPALPEEGGTVAGDVTVGGTGTSGALPPVGRLVIDLPAFTAPLVSANGYIGKNADGLGEATVTGFGSEWRATALMSVGYNGVGYLNITSGARVTSNAAAVIGAGFDPDSTVGGVFGLGSGGEAAQGFVNLTGFGSQWVNTNIAIGVNGFGRVEAFDRSQIITIDEAILGYDAALVQNELGTGYVLLDGKGTRWNVGDVSSTNSQTTTGDLTVGREGRGTIEIRNQALVMVERDTKIGSLVNGTTSQSFGQVYVTGADSKLWTFDNLFVGSSTSVAAGELYLINKGTARADIATTVSAHGLIDMADGGVLLSPKITNNGIIRGDGRLESGTASDAIVNNGQIRNGLTLHQLDVREKLWVTGPVINNGDFESIGGEMEFLSTFNNNGPNADIVAKDAILRFGGGVTNTGNVFLDNTIVWSPGTFVSNAALVLSASTSSLVGDLDLGSENSLLVELGHQFSRMEISRTADLDGILSISLGDDYIPRVGDKFEILEALSVTGTFDTVLDPNLSGIDFSVTYLANSVIVNVLGGFVFNADWTGAPSVGPEDLAVWQMNFGTMVPPGTLGDANGDGLVDGADFAIWQQQLGTTPAVAASGSAAGAVPEPSTIVMLVAALAAPLGLRRRARRAV